MVSLKNILIGSATALFLVVSQPLAAQEGNGNLKVAEAAVATGIEVLITEGGDLKPVGVAEVFDSAVGKLYLFSRIEGSSRNTTIKHRWYLEDQLIAEVELPVRSGNWRTYSSKIITPEMTGHWKVDIAEADGDVIKTLAFDVR